MEGGRTRIDVNKVREYFLLFSELPEEDAARWDITCRNAASAIERRLKEGADIAANHDRLCSAAAVWAHADYRLLSMGAAARVGEARVGDITLKSGTSRLTAAAEDAEEMRKYGLSQIYDLLDNPGPVFMATE
jgi:hypothetical protein